jgi:hypothetical protein
LFPDFVQLVRPLALLLLLGLFPVPLFAGQTTITPSLSLREEYNDNIFAQISGKHADFLSTVSPALALTCSSEGASASLAGGVSELWYLHNSANDGQGYFVRGAGSYAATPRLALSTDLSGTRDSTASSIDPVTSLVTNSRSLHQNYRVGERYQLSELASSSLSLGYGRDDYDSSAYLSTRHYLGSSQLEYDLGRYFPRVKLSQVLNLSRDTTDVSRVDSLSATLGLSRDLSELWRFSLNGGGRFTHSRFRPAGSTVWETHDEAGALGNLSLAYTGERFTAGFNLSQDLTSASGRSGSTQRTGVSLALSERITPRLSGSLGASYARNWSGKDQLGAGEINERYWNLGSSLRYDLGDSPSDFALETSYNYNNTDYRLLGAQMNQNVVMVRLVWQHTSTR